MKNSNRKKTGILMVLLAAVLVLNGCVRMQITADVAEDGEITGDVHLLVHPTAISMSGLKIDDVVRQLETDYQQKYPDAVVEKISEQVDGTIMEGVAIHTIRDSELHAEVTKDGMTVQFPIRNILNEVQKTANVDIATLKQYGSKAVLVINMPSAPETNIGTVSGNTVTIDLLNLPEGVNDAVITCGKASPAPPAAQISVVRRCVIAVQTLALVLTILRLTVKNPQQ